MNVYICGDSFCTSDPEYGASWVDLLESNLPDYNVINLAQPAASNLYISLQVNTAIKNHADYIIAVGTSVTRNEVAIATSDSRLIERFHSAELVAYSILSVPKHFDFTSKQTELLKQYHTEFFDLPLAIYRDCCIIENTLQRLVDSQIPFCFDRGGFEHPKFGPPQQPSYFDQYREHISQVNLWDYPTTKELRPYYHITDLNVHQTVANYYTNLILNEA